MRAVYVNHLGYGDPGAFGAALSSHGFSCEFVVREELDEGFLRKGAPSMMISLGSLSSLRKPDSAAWIRYEAKLMENVLKSGGYVVGVCFGAQLLAQIVGGEIFKRKHEKVGWINTIFQRCQHVCPRKEKKIFYWNSDGFSGVPGCISTDSEQCLIFQEENFIGFQGHVDVTPTLLERWASEAGVGQSFRESLMLNSDTLFKGSAAITLSIVEDAKRYLMLG